MSQITSARLPLDPTQADVLNNLIALADSGTCEFITKAGGEFVNTPAGSCAGTVATPINGIEIIGGTNVGLGGTLTQNTTIDGDATYSIDIENLASGSITTDNGNSIGVSQTESFMEAGGGNITINATGILIETPDVTGLTASANQVLTLQNATTGEVEYAFVEAIDVVYDNTTSGLTATDVQSAIDELDGDLDTLSGTVSTLAGDITTLQGDVTTIQGDITTIEGDITTIQGDITTINGIISGLPTVVVSTDADNAIVAGTDGGAYLDIADIDLSTIDWSTVNWTNFFADIDWTLNSWTDFFTSFYSEINWTDFIDEIVANWTSTNWNTFIDEFVDNVDSDDVTNLLNQAPGTNEWDVIRWDDTGSTWVIDEIQNAPSYNFSIAEQNLGGIICSSPTSNVDSAALVQSISNNDGSVIYSIFVSSGSSTSYELTRHEKDSTTGQYYLTHQTTLNSNSRSGIALLGSYVYTIGSSIRRYDIADLANQTTITISGTATVNAEGFSDGTFIYVNNSGTSYTQYSISGTTMTSTGVTVTGGMTSANIAWYSANESLVYMTDGSTVNTYTLGATTFTAITTGFQRKVLGLGYENESSLKGFVYINGSVMYYAYGMTISSNGITSDDKQSIIIKPFSNPA